MINFFKSGKSDSSWEGSKISYGSPRYLNYIEGYIVREQSDDCWLVRTKSSELHLPKDKVHINLIKFYRIKTIYYRVLAWLN